MSNVFIDTTTLEFPLYEEALLARLNVSVLPSNYAPVQFKDAPEFDSMTHVLEPTPPEFLDGVWSVRWSVKELSAEQKQLNILTTTKAPKVVGEATIDQIAGDAPDVIG